MSDNSLKKGCFILGVLQAISVLMNLGSLGNGGNVGSFLLSVVLLGMLYFIYKSIKKETYRW